VEKATIEQTINAEICLAIKLTSIVHVLKKRPVRATTAFSWKRANFSESRASEIVEVTVAFSIA
jgi:hypothetical protein